MTLIFSGVQHDDVIAHVDVRAEDGLVLALEAHGDLRAETAQDLVRSHPTTNQSPRTVSDFAKTVDITKDSNHRKSPHIAARSAEELGGDLTGGPLEKGAQVYSTPHAFAKPDARGVRPL